MEKISEIKILFSVLLPNSCVTSDKPPSSLLEFIFQIKIMKNVIKYYVLGQAHSTCIPGQL